MSAQLLPNGAIVVGFPWFGGKPTPVGLNSLGVRCLCTRHNSMLSELDDAAGALSRDLDEYLRVSAVRLSISQAKKKNWSLFTLVQDGIRLERWCGKFMCTTLAGGLYGAQLPSWTPPLPLVRFIFGQGRLAPSAGLYTRRQAGKVNVDDNSWGISPVGDPSNILGVGITFRALHFWFFPFIRRPTPISGVDIAGVEGDVMHHPRAVVFAGVNVELRFRWGRHYK